jgi:hypothetical protein
VGHAMHSSASSTRNIDALFFMLGWDQYGFHRKCTGIHYAELVCLHSVGPTSHVVHSSASRARNINAIFHARWARCGFQKKRAGTRYAELVVLHPVGSAGHVVHFGAYGP